MNFQNFILLFCTQNVAAYTNTKVVLNRAPGNLELYGSHGRGGTEITNHIKSNCIALLEFFLVCKLMERYSALRLLATFHLLNSEKRSKVTERIQ